MALQVVRVGPKGMPGAAALQLDRAARLRARGKVAQLLAKVGSAAARVALAARRAQNLNLNVMMLMLRTAKG